MNDRLTAVAAVFIALLLASCGPPPGSTAIAPAPQPSGPLAPAPLLEGVGQVSMPITTRSAQAQTYFNQGMALLYGYWWFEARRSFEASVA